MPKTLPVVAAMLLAEESGNYPLLRRFMGEHGERLIERGDQAYVELAARSDAAFAIEAERGAGSLLKLEHRTVRMLMNALTGSLVPAEHVEAAKRYQALTAAAA
jgi:hypothetical protein